MPYWFCACLLVLIIWSHETVIGERYADQAFHASDIRQRRTVRTCAAALNYLSTAAELGSVELIFMNAVASVGHGRRLSMDFSLDRTH